LRKARELFVKTGQLAIKLGGAISGEHGIGLAKKELFLEEIKAVRGEGYVEVVKMIKQLLDPNGIMNPGKIFL